MMSTSSRHHSVYPWASIYTPLDRNHSQIRLIEILPCNIAEDKVRCVLRTAESGPDACYAALSYVWGDPNVTEEIIVNDIVFPVTTNLASALRQFEKTGFPTDGAKSSCKITRLWVDAICINQKDIQERNHQVTLMASIYNDATAVLSWLGLPDQNYHNLAIQTIRKLSQAIFSDTISQDHADGFDERKRACFEWLITNLGPLTLNENRPGGVYWRALVCLAQSQYWSRMWIIQEMALARSDSAHWFICGDESILCQSLKAFKFFLRRLRQCTITSLNLNSVDEERIWGFLTHAITSSLALVDGAMDFVQDVALNSPIQGRLVQCISMSTFAASATDPRDFVYAMVNVTPNNIKPDYDKQTKDVYLAAVLSDGITRCVADCLSLSGNGRNYENDHNLPSWVPDFSKTKLSDVFGDIKRDPVLNFLELQPAEIIQRDILRIQGVTYDRVQSIGLPGLGLDAYGFKPVEKFLQHLCADYLIDFWRPKAMEKMEEKTFWCWTLQPLHALMNVLDCGKETDGDNFTISSHLDVGLPRAGCTCMRSLLRCGSLTRDERAKAQNRLGLPSDVSLECVLTMAFTGADFKGITENEHEFFKYDSFPTQGEFWAMITDASNKTLFRTDKGYLGIGPPDLQSGDLVCVLDQCPFSSLLRKHESHLEHVGACYVPALYEMNAPEMIRKGEMQVETFEIY